MISSVMVFISSLEKWKLNTAYGWDRRFMIQGLRTVIYHVTDLGQAKTWYSQVLEQEPYFDQPFYAGYSVGGFELGLIPDGSPGAIENPHFSVEKMR